MYLRSQNGETWLSDSDNQTELETSNPEYAQILVDMPGEVIKIKTEMKQVTEALKEMAKAVQAASVLHLEVSDSLIKTQAKLDEAFINSIIKKTQSSEEMKKTQLKTLGEYDGMMFE